MRDGQQRRSGRVRELRRLGAGAFIVVAAVAAASFVPAPAAAHHAPSGCDYLVGKPYRVDSRYVRAVVGRNNCSINAFRLGRERWYGWQTLDRAVVPDGATRTLSWNCEGSGTYTYFSWHEGHWDPAHNSSDSRISC